MSSQKIIKVLLAGYGTVGKGICQLIDRCDQRLDLPWKIQISKILVQKKTPDRVQECPSTQFVTSLEEFYDFGFDDHEKPDIVIEAIGGVDTAFQIISEALDRGLSVVSANKDLIDLQWNILQEKSQKTGQHLRYEASVAGGIPIIHTINRGLLANRIEGLFAILNGTANYCLTQMIEKAHSLKDVIGEAQAKGYAEADPSSDIEGKDSAHKICILSRLCYETNFSFQDILTEGIIDIEGHDLNFLYQKGLSVRLLGIARRFSDGVDLRVHPCYFSSKHPFESVRGVNNAILIDGDATGEVFLYGQGAGRYPTASAVVSDIFELCEKISSREKISVPLLKNTPQHIVSVDSLEMKYYFRLTVKDQSGVLSKLTLSLAQNKINVHIIEQSPCPFDSQLVHIRIITDSCKEKNMQNALKNIHQEIPDDIRLQSLLIRQAPWEETSKETC